MNKFTEINSSTREFSQAVEAVRQYNENIKQATGLSPSAFTHSYGCQQNVADGQNLDGILLQMGYVIADAPEVADVVLYNTCAIRENAEDRVFGNIGDLKKAKEENPDMIIGVCGCMVQQKHVFERLEKSYPFVDLLFGAGAMHTLPNLLLEKMQQGRRIVEIGNPTFDIMEDLPIHRENAFQAYVPIMTGCDNFCTYCIVPFVRGRERSRKPEAILQEVKSLLAEGYKDITLLGQNVNSYGKNLQTPLDFSDLLAEIAQLPGKFRLRFTTSHPKDCSRKLIDTMAQYDKIAKHLHLPVQSGSNRMLEQMNRGYTVEHYFSLIDYAHRVAPEISFTSDLIVGFPGETEEDFQATLDLVETVGYTSLFTFAFSPRKGTKAAKMENTLTQEEKTNRFDRLLALQRKKANEYNRTLVGQTLEVLVEGYSSNKEGYLTGHTDNNIIVLFQGGEELIGTFVPVLITEYRNWAVEGVLQPHNEI